MIDRTFVRTLTIAAAAAGLIASGSPASAQQTGSLTGRVTGPDGQPLVSASVALLSSGQQTTTTSTGAFRFVGVPTGEHRVAIQYFGFRADTLVVRVGAGERATLDIPMQVAAIVLPGVTAIGERGGQYRSINAQRNSATVISVVSADEIGTLPDRNVAEAVQRLSSVSIQTDNGEGRFVSIRGTAPNLNTVTIDGQTLASTAESRATALDLLPAAMVSSIEVTKAVTPDMDGNAIGGSINVRTLSAFDRDRPFVFGTAQGGWYDQQLDFGDPGLPYEANLTVGRQLGGDWGLVLSGSASRRDFTPSDAHPTLWQPIGDVFVPQRQINIAEATRRERYGANATLEYRPSDLGGVFLRTYYSRTDELDEDAEYIYQFARGELTEQTPVSGRYSMGSGALDMALTEEDEELYSATLGVDRRFGAVRLDGAASFTRGTLNRFTRKTEFTTGSQATFANRYTIENGFVTLEPENLAEVRNGDNYAFDEVDLEYESNTENTGTGAASLRWDTRAGGLPAFLKLGGKVQRRDKEIDDLERGYAEGSSPITLAAYPRELPGTMQGGSSLWVIGDTRRFYEFFLQNESNPTYFEFDGSETETEGVENDSNNSENVYAGFLMGQVDIDRLSVLAGARVEHTRTKSQRWQLLVNEDTEEQQVTSQTFTNDYTNVLPAVILKLAATDRLVLRGAFTSAIGRPDYEELSGFRSFEYTETPDAGIHEGSIEEGNPLLEPYRASNVDASAEYYFTSGGMISLGGFYKHIANPIYEFDITQTDVTVEGLFFGEIRYRQDRNAESGWVRGIEAAVQQALVFLPKPFDGLGITANVAFIDSEVSVPGRDDRMPFFGQSDLVANVIPYYQRGPVELRAAWSYQSAYLRDIGEEAWEDRYWDDRSTIDLTARYSLLNGVRLFAQMRNVTNEPIRGYQAVSGRTDAHTIAGRSLSFGLSASY